MSISKSNQQKAQELSLNLRDKDEIDHKTEYWKNTLILLSELTEAIDKKIESETEDYEKIKLKLEKIDVKDKIFSVKGFYEMWLDRSKEYDKKFEMVTKNCNENFDATFEKFKELAKNNLLLTSWLTKWENEPEKTQRLKNEFYALISYEITKASKNKLEYSLGK